MNALCREGTVLSLQPYGDNKMPFLDGELEGTNSGQIHFQFVVLMAERMQGDLVCPRD